MGYVLDAQFGSMSNNYSSCDTASTVAGTHILINQQQQTINGHNAYRCKNGIDTSMSSTGNYRVNGGLYMYMNSATGGTGIKVLTGVHVQNITMNYMGADSVGLELDTSHSVISGNSIHSNSAYTPIKLTGTTSKLITITGNQLLGNQAAKVIDLSTAIASSGTLADVTITGNSATAGTTLSASQFISYPSGNLANVTGQEIGYNAVQLSPVAGSNYIDNWQAGMGSRSDWPDVALYGDGSDGDLILDSTTQSECSALATTYSSLLDACSWVFDAACVCALEANSNWGDSYDNTLLDNVGTVLNLKSLTIASGNVLTLKDKEYNNPHAAGAQAWLKVQGDVNIVGQIQGNSMGANGKQYSGSTGASGVGNTAGCSTFFALGGSLGTASADGGDATNAFRSETCTTTGENDYCTSSFFLNSSFEFGPQMLLFGAAGGKASGGTDHACKNLNGTLPVYSLGAPGGGAGECVTATTVTTTPGRGGGGLYLSVGGNYTLTGQIQLKGQDGTQGAGGGGGGTMLLRVGKTRTDSSGTYIFSGGSGNTNCGTTGATNGGDGGTGVLAILD